MDVSKTDWYLPIACNKGGTGLDDLNRDNIVVPNRVYVTKNKGERHG
jgi:hypothetical protein